VTFAAALAAIRRGAEDVDILDDLARGALAEGEEENALPIIKAAAAQRGSPLLWQWTGLLHRAVEDLEPAVAAFSEASRLAPADASIAHGHARVTLEAGLDAISLFQRARGMAPQDGAVLLGLAAALNTAGKSDQAIAELELALDRSPLWTEGHEQLAQLLSVTGRPNEATASVERAISRAPHEQSLWATLFAIRVRREEYRTLASDVDRARAAGVPAEALALYEAISAAELDDSAYPAALFDSSRRQAAPALGIWRIRHLLRVGEVAAALAIIDQELRTDRAFQIWPYASLAWRLTGDARSEWLEAAPELVRVSDLTSALPELEMLAETLRALHIAKGEYLDQSVRGGTQTDGPLLSRIDPVIRNLREAIVDAVENYVSLLPPPDPRHPLLGKRRDRRIRFSGSWSVRLRSGGRHSNHVHPQGWISSALYVALPERGADEPVDSGWFTLGQPDEKLNLNIEPLRKIEPRPGQLVLFPSWMWHGTVPFAEGERLTVAFDVKPPI
jgi:tetratricopeptide (TPR) repeat protein